MRCSRAQTVTSRLARSTKTSMEGLLTGRRAERDYQSLFTRKPASITWVRPSLFADSLREHLVDDTQAIQSLLAEFGEWDPAQIQRSRSCATFS